MAATPAFAVLITAQAFRDTGSQAESLIREAGGSVNYPPRMGPLPPEELVPYLREADAVIAASDPYTEAVLEACPRLRVVVRWGTGCDSVDLAACTRQGVLACNAPGLNVEAVADHVFAVLLALARRLPEQWEVMRSGAWAEVRGTEIWGKTLGLVGFGGIGKAVARRARGFDLRVLAYDPHLTPGAIRAAGGEPVTLARLFAEADFVSVHAALTAENRGMVGEALLRSMKPGAFFINAARGPLVEEEALIRALREGWIAGAAVDAYCTEPLPADHPLRSLPNCLPTPHSAFNTAETAEATNRAVAGQVLQALRGERPRFLLNPEVLDHPHLRARVAG